MDVYCCPFQVNMSYFCHSFLTGMEKNLFIGPLVAYLRSCKSSLVKILHLTQWLQLGL